MLWPRFYQSGSRFHPGDDAAFDAMVGAPDGLSAQQAMVVLFGMADDFEGGIAGLGGLYQIATEVGALIGRGAFTAQEVADGVTAEISGGHFTIGVRPCVPGLRDLGRRRLHRRSRPARSPS